MLVSIVKSSTKRGIKYSKFVNLTTFTIVLTIYMNNIIVILEV